MSLWVERIFMPAYDSGFTSDANDASEKAEDRRSFTAIGLILMVTSLCFLAVWRVLLANFSVVTVAWFICDWSIWLIELVRSGRVRAAAH